MSRKKLRKVILKVIKDYGIKDDNDNFDSFKFIVGGALGIDQMAFSIVNQLKRKRVRRLLVYLILNGGKSSNEGLVVTSLTTYQSSAKISLILGTHIACEPFTILICK